MSVCWLDKGFEKSYSKEINQTLSYPVVLNTFDEGFFFVFLFFFFLLRYNVFHARNAV